MRKPFVAVNANSFLCADFLHEERKSTWASRLSQLPPTRCCLLASWHLSKFDVPHSFSFLALELAHGHGSLPRQRPEVAVH